MKIVIAAWHLKDLNVGLGRYCRRLIEAIGRVDHENRYEILMPVNNYRFPERPNIRYRLIRFPLFKRRFWEQVAQLLVGHYDLLHFPYNSCVAWKRGKFLMTIPLRRLRIAGAESHGVRLPGHQLECFVHTRGGWGRGDPCRHYGCRGLY